MKKKVISIILILVMLLLPFSMLLKVNAEGEFQITTDIDGVVNNTGTITIASINTKYDNNQFVSADTFKAYKVLDILYNQLSNAINYRFTTDFGNFVSTLTPAEVRAIVNSEDPNKTAFTVDDYLNLTSDGIICESRDEQTGVCNASFSEDMTNTSSTLNILVSKYATYISSRKNTASPISGITMVSDEIDEGHGDSTIVANGVVAGSYLILPDSIITDDTKSFFFDYITKNYGVMVANVWIGLSNSGEGWELKNANLVPKSGENHIGFILGNYTISEVRNDFNLLYTSDRNIGISIGKSFTVILQNQSQNKVPVNTHSSITSNSDIMSSLGVVEVTLPAGFEFDFNNISDIAESRNLTWDGNDVYATVSGELVKVFTKVSNSKIKLVSDAIALAIEVVPDNSLNAGTINNITLTQNILSNPYADIGSNPTVADVAKAVSTITATGTVTTYGLIVNNVNSNNQNLNGAEFSVCHDATCSSVIKSGVVISNGVGSFAGVSGDDVVYVVQTKAPTGYRLADPVAVDLSTLQPDGNSYYSSLVVNQPILSLPFTGGAGTIIYTVIGLVIAGGAITFIVLYKKKNKK